VDVGAAQEIGFVNKQRVEFTVGEIEASYINAVPTLWDAAAATGNARRDNLASAVLSTKQDRVSQTFFIVFPVSLRLRRRPFNVIPLECSYAQDIVLYHLYLLPSNQRHDGTSSDV